MDGGQASEEDNRSEGQNRKRGCINPLPFFKGAFIQGNPLLRCEFLSQLPY
jgi:hypothetical protein